MRLYCILSTAIATFVAVPADAYVGPGLGLGALGVVSGLFLSLVMAFFAFVWLPVKRLFSPKKQDVAGVGTDEA
ncbi:MAG: hypothetical protein ACE5DK_01025 [Paracoccaceae bacterium]